MARFYEPLGNARLRAGAYGVERSVGGPDAGPRGVAAARVSGMTALAWVIAGLAAIVLVMLAWVFRLQRWSRVYRDVIEAHTRSLTAQGSELTQLRSDLLEAHIRLDRLDPI